MKRIVNGARYDTDTAEEIADYSSGGYCSDFRYYEETLYRTKNGNFFLVGKGGPASKYSEECGQNSWTSGKRLIPMSRAIARAWCEETENTNAIEKHFADDIVDA